MAHPGPTRPSHRSSNTAHPPNTSSGLDYATSATLLPNDDIVNPHDFNVTIYPADPCGITDDLHLLAIVHSAPGNLKERMYVRRTWGNSKWYPMSHMRVIFALGIPESEQLRDALLLESSLYNDILQEDFEDHYRNLTYKAIMWLKWTSQLNCSGSLRYILKTDDDMFINIFSLANHLQAITHYDVINQTTSAILCLLKPSAPVLRNETEKWFVTWDEVPFEEYGMHCPGLAYILTADLVEPFFRESLKMKFFWIDDIYVTGFLPERLGNVTFQDLGSLYSVDYAELTERNLQGTLVFGVQPDLNARYVLWNELLEIRQLQEITD